MSVSSGEIPLFGNGSQCYAPACRPLSSPSLFCGTYHWTSARPTQLSFAVAQCLYPPPLFFPLPFHSSYCPWYFFSSISSITSQHVSSALGNVHEMLDKLLTQRIFCVHLEKKSYSCDWPPEGRDCIGCSFPFFFKSIFITTHSYFLILTCMCGVK